VYCWGDGLEQKVTGCATNDSHCYMPGVNFFSPHEVNGVAGTIGSIAVGSRDVCVLRSSMSQAVAVVCWGANGLGQIGNGTTAATGTALSPTQVGGMLQTPSALAATTDGECALDNAGMVSLAFCWGSNGSGTTGQPTTTGSTDSPAIVTPSVFFSRIAAGTHDVCATSVDGYVFCWGTNTSHALGTSSAPMTCGTAACATTPVRVPFSGTHAFDLIAVGASFACAHDALDDSVWCWGANDSAQVGLGLPNPAAPARVQLPTR
jgi:alpha-tubulin suppressor-like RCC1 family protein